MGVSGINIDPGIRESAHEDIVAMVPEMPAPREDVSENAPEEVITPEELATMEHRERIEKLREKYRRMKEEKEEGNAAV